MKKVLTVVAVAMALAVAGHDGARAAASHEAALRNIVDTKIMPWLNNPVVISAIKAQNAKNAGLTQAQIDKLDKQWRAETKSGDKPLIGSVMSNALSAYLKKVKVDGKGLYTEIFVTDDKGLNVGQSDVTSDYWQGDEAKWQKTYPAGPGAVFIDKVEKDESTQRFQSQVSVAISDPDTKKAIGAITVGIDMEAAGF